MPLVKKPEDIKLQADPRAYPDYTEKQVQALRAVNRGEATAAQQREAIEFIVNIVSGAYDISYRPDMEGATLVAEGKAIVGKHIVWLLKQAPTKTDPVAIAARPKEESENG